MSKRDLSTRTAGIRRVVAPLLGMAMLAIVWQLVATTLLANLHVLPGPVELVQGLWKDRAFYPPNIAATASVALKGYVAGNGFAIALALICILLPRLAAPIMRIALVAYAVPLLAVAPILVVVCHGDTARVILAALAVFFTTLVNTHSSLRHADETMLHVVRVAGGGRAAQLFKVRLWESLPTLFGALKVAAPAALLGAIIAEFLGADRGLGTALVVAQQNLDAVRTFGIATVAAAMAGASYALIGAAGRWATPWLRDTSRRS